MKNLFIGIDFSKKTFDVSFFERGKEEEVNYKQFANAKEGFQQLLKWIKQCTKIKQSQWLFCGEHTGLYSVSLTDFLLKKDLFIWLENPLQIKLSSGIKRQKNDKADSKVIALYAYRFEDRAKCCNASDKNISSLSLLLCFRDRLVRTKRTLLISAVEMRTILKRDPTARYIYEQSQLDVDRLNKQIKEIENKMKELINATELKENYNLVSSVKGISLINTVAIMVSTLNFTRFDNGRQFACYAGVVPFENTSGTSIKSQKKISGLANQQVKSLLTQAARAAVTHDSQIRQYYQRKLQQGKNERLIINNVRNKLIQRIFAVVKSKIRYQEDYKNNIEYSLM